MNNKTRFLTIFESMLKASLKAIEEIPLWQKLIIGAAGVIATQAFLRAVEYFLQEIEEPLEKELDEFLRDVKRKGKLSETECQQLRKHIIMKLNLSD